MIAVGSMLTPLAVNRIEEKKKKGNGQETPVHSGK